MTARERMTAASVAELADMRTKLDAIKRDVELLRERDGEAPLSLEYLVEDYAASISNMEMLHARYINRFAIVEAKMPKLIADNKAKWETFLAANPRYRRV